MRSENLLDLLTWVHTEFPAIDRGNFFAGISLSLAIVGFIAFKYFFSTKKRTIKISFLFLGVILLFFSTFCIKEIQTTCSSCGVSYTYNESYFCGLRVKIYGFKTREPKYGYLISYPMASRMCLHSWMPTEKIRFFGGILPMVEYHFGDISFRILNSNEKLTEKPYPITKDMVLTEFSNENEKGYTKETLEE